MIQVSKSVISNNNRVNTNMLTTLSNDCLKTKIPNFFDNSQTIYLLFDSVHILKAIRNNYVKQETEENAFIFPSFGDKVLEASF